VTGVCALVHIAVQQNLRQGANDPQVQLAEDAAAAITGGTQIDQVVPTQKVDISHSLAPWMAVYTNTGVPLLSSGQLNGEVPQLPTGVFDTSNWESVVSHHLTVFYSYPADENRFTWQPQPGVRQAVVLVHYDSQNGVGFVAVGRSLREVEARESQLTLEVFVAWAGILLVLLVASIAVGALVRP
jgi:hypothetical protein